jgi:hypothetical protein
MLNKPQLGAALLAFSSCCPNNGMVPIINGCPETALPEGVPTIDIMNTASYENGSPLPQDDTSENRRHYRIPVPNPVIDEQQKLWNCIFELNPPLMMECMDQIIVSGNCYNDGVNAIIDGNLKIPECRAAQTSRNHGGAPYEIKKAMTKEAQCLTVVMEKDADILRPLDPCFTEELSCLREQIRNNSLVCTAEDQEARYGI